MQLKSMLKSTAVLASLSVFSMGAWAGSPPVINSLTPIPSGGITINWTNPASYPSGLMFNIDGAPVCGLDNPAYLSGSGASFNYDLTGPCAGTCGVSHNYIIEGYWSAGCNPFSGPFPCPPSATSLAMAGTPACPAVGAPVENNWLLALLAGFMAIAGAALLFRKSKA